MASNKPTIKDSFVKTYKIIPPIGGVIGWGAKGHIFTTGGEVTTGEVLGKTEQEAEKKAQTLTEKCIKELGSC